MKKKANNTLRLIKAAANICRFLLAATFIYFDYADCSWFNFSCTKLFKKTHIYKHHSMQISQKSDKESKKSDTNRPRKAKYFISL